MTTIVFWLLLIQKSMLFKPRRKLSSAAFLWLLTPATLSSIPPVAQAPLPISLNSGAAAGSLSTPPVLPLLLHVPASWGARYPYYLLSDSREGQLKEAEVTRSAPSSQPTRNSIRRGFVYERVPHITLKSIANNAEIDVIWEKFQEKLEDVARAVE